MNLKYAFLMISGAILSFTRKGVSRSILLRLRTFNSNSYGQAMVEYVITTCVLIAMVAIMAVFLYTFKENGGRILDLAASEYP